MRGSRWGRALATWEDYCWSGAGIRAESSRVSLRVGGPGCRGWTITGLGPSSAKGSIATDAPGGRLSDGSPPSARGVPDGGVDVSVAAREGGATSPRTSADAGVGTRLGIVPIRQGSRSDGCRLGNVFAEQPKRSAPKQGKRACYGEYNPNGRSHDGIVPYQGSGADVRQGVPDRHHDRGDGPRLAVLRGTQVLKACGCPKVLNFSNTTSISPPENSCGVPICNAHQYC